MISRLKIAEPDLGLSQFYRVDKNIRKIYKFWPQ
jgi:hypothetical protein